MAATARARPAQRRRGDGYAMLLVATSVVAWGLTPRVTAVGGPHTEPLMLTALRAAPTALLLLLALPILRYRLPQGRTAWLWTGASGLLMVTVFLGGFTEAIIRAGPGNAIVLASTTPFFVVVLNRILFGERVSVKTLAGLVVGFAGVVLVVSSQLGGDAGGSDLALGMALALVAAIAWGVGTIVVKELVVRHPQTDLVGLTTGQYLIGGAVLLGLGFGIDGSEGTEWSSGDLWLSIAFISVVGSALATVTYFAALKRLSATRVVAWLFLSPVVAVLLEIALGHVPDTLVLVGMALTIAGVAIVNAAPQLPSRSGTEIATTERDAAARS